MSIANYVMDGLGPQNNIAYFVLDGLGNFTPPTPATGTNPKYYSLSLRTAEISQIEAGPRIWAGSLIPHIHRH